MELAPDSRVLFSTCLNKKTEEAGRDKNPAGLFFQKKIVLIRI